MKYNIPDTGTMGSGGYRLDYMNTTGLSTWNPDEILDMVREKPYLLDNDNNFKNYVKALAASGRV